MVVVAVFEAKLEKVSELRVQINYAAQMSGEEYELPRYSVHHLKNAPGSFLIVAPYKSKETFENDLETSHVKSIISQQEDLTDGEAQIFQTRALFASKHEKSSL